MSAPDTSIRTPRIEHTGSQGHVIMHVNPESAVEIIANDKGYIINRFRNGQGWEEIYGEILAISNDSLGGGSEALREAAMIISDLLATIAYDGKFMIEQDYVWCREAKDWLREQWKRDPETTINAMVAGRIKA